MRRSIPLLGAAAVCLLTRGGRSGHVRLRQQRGGSTHNRACPSGDPHSRSLPPTATPAPKYTNPDTGESCANVITQAEIDAAAANNKLTLPFPPCARMDKPFYYQDFDRGQIIYFYAPKGTPIVSPFAGEFVSVGAGDPAMLYGRGGTTHIVGEDYFAYLFTENADFDPTLFGTRVERGQVIGYVGDPLPGQPGVESPSLGLDITPPVPPQLLHSISEPQHWAGGQPNFYVP